MGKAFNPKVNVIFNQTDEADAIRTLQAPFQGGNLSDAFVLAKVENPDAACRLSFIVIGEKPGTVAEFLAEKTRSGIAQGPLKHALEDVESVFRLASSTAHFEAQFGLEALKRDEMRALDQLVPKGCCSDSTGVSVLIVNKPEGAREYRQILLTNKYIRCTFHPNESIDQLQIVDSPGGEDPTYKPCK